MQVRAEVQVVVCYDCDCELVEEGPGLRSLVSILHDLSPDSLLMDA